MLKLLFDGQAKLAERNCVSLLGDKFWRVAPRFLDKSSGLDNIDVMTTIKEEMENFDLGAAVEWIEKNFK